MQPSRCAALCSPTRRPNGYFILVARWEREWEQVRRVSLPPGLVAAPARKMGREGSRMAAEGV